MIEIRVSLIAKAFVYIKHDALSVAKELLTSHCYTFYSFFCAIYLFSI